MPICHVIELDKTHTKYYVIVFLTYLHTTYVSFICHTIYTPLRVVISTAETGVESAVFVDLDGDSDIDIVSSTYNAAALTEVLWFENDGSQAFSRHVIANTAYTTYNVFAIDLDQDGYTNTNTYTII
jgi:hypothetical protein